MGMTSVLSQILVFGILLFLAIGSGVLAWDGLALAVGRARQGGAGERWARLKLVAGLIGVGLAVWLAVGYLNQVR